MVKEYSVIDDVQISSEDFPVIAINVLERLRYHITRSSKQLNQILATEKLDELVGRDRWHYEYSLILRWDKDGSKLKISITVSELRGVGTVAECKKRCEKVMSEILNDALRANKIKAEKEPSIVHGSARWGSQDELKSAGYFTLAPDPKRLIIGMSDDGDYIQVPELLTYSHAIVCGRTGVGKSRGFFIPQLIERIGTSMIVTEATPGFEDGELYKLTSGWREKAGHRIYCFNPADMSSHRINPIDRIRHAPIDQKAFYAEKLADLIVMNGETEGGRVDQTWNRSEKLLLIPLLLHAAVGEPKYGHLGALRWLLLQGPDKLANILSKSPSELAQLEFEGWMRLSGETNFKYGVFSGLITKLNPFMTDQIVALTETTDVDLDELKNQLFTFYLAVPSRSKDSKLLGALLVNFLLDYILEVRAEMRFPMAMLLDEFTNFGKIAGIDDVLSIIRKNKIGLVLGFQNYFQLEKVYSQKEAQIIIDMPATQVYFKQKNFKEAKILSEALGRTTIEETTFNDSGRIQETAYGRALITPEELINLSNQVIIFTPNTWPLKLDLIEPNAYDSCFEYEIRPRDKHEINEFITMRGRVARKQSSEEGDVKKQKFEQNKTKEKDYKNANFRRDKPQVAEYNNMNNRKYEDSPDFDILD